MAVKAEHRLHCAELHPPDVHLVRNRIGPGATAVKTSDVVTDIRNPHHSLPHRELCLEIQHLPGRVCIPGKVNRRAMCRPSAWTSRCRPLPGRPNSREHKSPAAPRPPFTSVLLVDPRVRSEARRRDPACITAPVEPPNVDSLLLKRLVYSHVRSCVGGLSPVPPHAGSGVPLPSGTLAANVNQGTVCDALGSRIAGIFRPNARMDV